MTESTMREFHMKEPAGEAEQQAMLSAGQDFIASNGCPLSILIVITDGDGGESHHYLWGDPGPRKAAVARAKGHKAWALGRHPKAPMGFLLVVEKTGRRIYEELDNGSGPFAG